MKDSFVGKKVLSLTEKSFLLEQVKDFENLKEASSAAVGAKVFNGLIIHYRQLRVDFHL